jgi:hypothetical protein
MTSLTASYLTSPTAGDEYDVEEVTVEVMPV